MRTQKSRGAGHNRPHAPSLTPHQPNESLDSLSLPAVIDHWPPPHYHARFTWAHRRHALCPTARGCCQQPPWFCLSRSPPTRSSALVSGWSVKMPCKKRSLSLSSAVACPTAPSPPPMFSAPAKPKKSG